jgi:hypothetical protein
MVAPGLANCFQSAIKQNHILKKAGFYLKPAFFNIDIGRSGDSHCCRIGRRIRDADRDPGGLCGLGLPCSCLTW